MFEQGLASRHYLRLLARQGWLIVLVAAVALACAAFFVGRQQTVYRASMGILVAQAGGTAQPQLGNLPLTQTMTNILESDVVAEQVRRELNLRLSSSDLLKKLSVQTNPDSSVLNVSYDSPNKREALRILTALGTEFNSLIRQRLGVSGSLTQTGPLRIVASIFNPPHLEPGQVSPQPTRVLAFAGAVGLVLGLILAFARDAFDDRIRGRREAEEAFGAPAIGVLPSDFAAERSAGSSLVPNSTAAEAIRHLCTNLQVRSAHTGPALLVTTAMGDGDTAEVVANLGAALADAGQVVVCVEADRGRPGLHSLLVAPDDAVDSRDGMVAVLEGKVDASDAFLQISLDPSRDARMSVDNAGEGRLVLLPAGESSNAAALSSLERWADLVRQLSGIANYVLFDCPQLLSIAHGLPLASAVDGVLVVARLGHTRRAHAHALRADLEALGLSKVGLILIESRSLPNMVAPRSAQRRSRRQFSAEPPRKHAPTE